jgi:hypothetical protein
MIGGWVARDRNLVPCANDYGIRVGPPAAFKFTAKIFGKRSLHQNARRATASSDQREIALAQRIGKPPPRESTLPKPTDGAQGGKAPHLLESVKIPLPESILEKGSSSIRQRKPSVPPVFGKENRHRIGNSSRRNDPPCAARQAQKGQQAGGQLPEKRPCPPLVQWFGRLAWRRAPALRHDCTNASSSRIGSFHL